MWLHEKLPLYYGYLEPGADEEEIKIFKAAFAFKLPD
jgi:hypothetical protein